MNRKKKLPIGKDDFKKLVTENCYYFDKTKLIEQILESHENHFEVTLFTRPRRFGKTLNMSMLKYFFDVKNKEENKKLFENLYISKSEYFEKQGQNPVISLSFKDIRNNNWEESFGLIKNLIFDLYYEHKYVLEKLDETKKEEYNQILHRKDDISFFTAIKKLSEFLYIYYEKKVIILIDEYDATLVSAYEKGYYNEAINFFRTLYSSALKGNEYLEIAVLTGILKVVKEGIFSGLNNLKVYTVLDKKYETSFGLEEEEIIKALEYYGNEDTVEDVRKWYNGYKFGDEKVYNPWSIINYLSDKELRSYWVNVAQENTINRLIKEADESMFEDLRLIFSGISVEKEIDGHSNMENLQDPEEIWKLMLFSGYLTIDEEMGKDEYTLKIPNYEIYTFFQDSFIKENFKRKSNFKQMMRALLDKDLEFYHYKLQEIMLISYSYYDGEKLNEKPYHNLILGTILQLDDLFKIESNIERGYGRTDLIMTPRNNKYAGYIFEFKAVEDEKDIETELENALRQINDKKYGIKLRDEMEKLENTSEIIKIGMVFCGKKVEMKWEIEKISL